MSSCGYRVGRVAPTHHVVLRNLRFEKQSVLMKNS